MHVAIVNYPYPAQARSPAELLARFPALTGWAEALRAAGATVTVLQRYRADAAIERAGVRYLLVGEPGGPDLGGWRTPRRLHAAAAAAGADVVHLNGQIFPLQTLALRRALPGRAPWPAGWPTGAGCAPPTASCSPPRRWPSPGGRPA